MCNCNSCICIKMTTQEVCFDCRNGKHNKGSAKHKGSRHKNR